MRRYLPQGGDEAVELWHWNQDHDGPLTEAALRNKLSAMGYRVSLYHYPPGTYFPPHCHEVDKIDAVLAGRFRMEMNGQAVILEAGDCLVVPRGELHSAEVVGNTSVVSLDAARQG
jgi:quercetin dioxygenase-like cupin family protein